MINLPYGQHRILLCGGLLAGFLFCGQLQAAATDLLERIGGLDQGYQQLMGGYQAASHGEAEPIGDIDELLASMLSVGELEHPLVSVRLLAANFDTLLAAADNPAFAQITEFLLRQNQWQLVTRIYQAVEENGSDSGLAYLRYNLARYHARLNQWEKVFSLVGDTFSELSGDDSDYAYLLQGSALQHLKQHRRAIESYASIPESSKYYLHAQINTAIAQLRQGWITDARLILEKIIPVSKNNADAELTNRIYLLLGYALLNKEYYRDARTAFRRISLDSQYANKALLGIALTAINQGDYVGGLNALDILKQKQGPDLAADEAYVILPYVYDRLQQPNRIADSFLESIDHYQKRIIELDKIKNGELSLADIQLEKNSGDIYLGDKRFEFSQHYPAFLLQNRSSLHYLSRIRPDQALVARIERLLTQHDEVLTEVIFDIIERRKKIYTSYLNQSRYGLARHYDTTQQDNQ